MRCGDYDVWRGRQLLVQVSALGLLQRQDVHVAAAVLHRARDDLDLGLGQGLAEGLLLSPPSSVNAESQEQAEKQREDRRCHNRHKVPGAQTGGGGGGGRGRRARRKRPDERGKKRLLSMQIFVLPQ